MSVTIDEVAAQVKLHKGSVSRILSGKGAGYSDQTKRRVLEAAAQMGYRPNRTAQALKTGTTQMVALWLLAHEMYSPYFGYVHHCLQHAGIGYGYQLITEDVRLATVNQAESSQLVQWPVDGILACDVATVAAEYLRATPKRRTPIVTIGQGSVPETDYVSVDLYAGAREAVAHLLAAGCRRIAYAGRSQTDARSDAYAGLMEEAGKPTEYLATPEDSRRAGYQSLRAYVEAHGCPDGLFCLNDEIAIGCYLALSELGIRVPDDALLVGFDGLENARSFPCPISSVVIPIEEMCTLAWDILIQRLREPEAPRQQRTLAPHLEVRASSRP